jgi:RNA polymerase sigma factor (TIGR02999 family)
MVHPLNDSFPTIRVAVTIPSDQSFVMGSITSLLQELKDGRAGATDRLFALVYDDLKLVAHHHLQKCPARALQATALVSAAYERLAARESLEAADRKHLFYLFSRAMHDVLVEQVRADLALKRGRQLRQVPLLEVAVEGHTQSIDILDLHEALSELGLNDPEAARVVMLRYYGGLSLEEAAEATSSTFAITRRHWEYAKAWLHERLTV